MRSVNQQDQEILSHLRRHFNNHVRIGFDISFEPVIEYEHNGLWEMVYKLSSTGHYVGFRDTYVYNAYVAIKSHLIYKWEQRHKETEDIYKKEKSFQDEVERRKRQILNNIKPKEIYE